MERGKHPFQGFGIYGLDMLIFINKTRVVPIHEIILKSRKVYEYCYDADK